MFDSFYFVLFDECSISQLDILFISYCFESNNLAYTITIQTTKYTNENQHPSLRIPL